MKTKHLEELSKAIANRITEREDAVFPYIGNNNYVLDQNELYETIKKAIEEY